MYEVIIDLHRLFILLFTLYILIDRLYIRNFIKEKNRKDFYNISKAPMLFISFIIISSGIALLFYSNIIAMLIVKVILAICLIFAFFYCPFYMKEESSNIKKVMYRYFVVVLLVCTLSLGFYI